MTKAIKIGTVTALVTIMAAVLGAYIHIDTRIDSCALAEDVRRADKALNMRIDVGTMLDLARDLRQQIWDIEKHYRQPDGSCNMPPHIRQQVNKLRAERQGLLKEIEARKKILLESGLK